MTGASRAVHVTFQPEGRTIAVMPGTSLLEAAALAGIVMETPCGGAGTCGKCRVVVSKGAPEPTDNEREILSADDIASGARLACRVNVRNDMVVNIPLAARFFEQKILTDGQGRQVALEPTVIKRHFQLDPPSLKDLRSDMERILDAMDEGAEASVDAARDLPAMMREAKFSVTGVAAENRLIAVEPGDTTNKNYGVAFDIGTTTVVGFLLDLVSGRELAVAARTNPQVAYGDDVLSRIHFAGTQANGLAKLQSVIVECMNDIIAECCAKAGVPLEHLYEATVAGNTTMLHLLLGVDPQYLARAPYVGAFRSPQNLRAAEIGLRIHPQGILHTLPNIAGFVGADTVAVILASGLHESQRPILAIDIGTNGELVVGNKDRILACSTAAGPAFEGARIAHGMRASEGAIRKVIFNSDVEYDVIGEVAPRGICGTGLIDVAAELIRTGIVDSSGRMQAADELDHQLPDALRKRVIKPDGGAFVLAPAAETRTDRAITISQRDVRELQLAKAAIAAGTRILLEEFGIGIEEVEHVLLAGAFGNFIRRESAKGIGLLPEVPDERILYIGNAAGAGARMTLLSRRAKEEANSISRRVQYVELAGRQEFHEVFTDALMFPEARG